MTFWQRILANALLFLAISGFLPNVFHVSSVLIALVASLVLAILNAAIKPFFVLLSLPITIVTLGLFSIVINAAMLQMTAFFVGNGFYFASFGASMVVALILSITNMIITNYFSQKYVK